MTMRVEPNCSVLSARLEIHDESGVLLRTVTVDFATNTIVSEYPDGRIETERIEDATE